MNGEKNLEKIIFIKRIATGLLEASLQNTYLKENLGGKSM